MSSNIYYLGPSGSFSYIITNKISTDSNAISCKNFAEIISSTLTAKNSIGVFPIENSITSNVHENMDYLFKENLTVIAEAYLKIRLNLLGMTNSNIKEINTVYSHPQALAQCSGYISKKNLAIFATDSTAAAKEIILKINDLHSSIIGGKDLAGDGRLKILDENIGDEELNITRFLIVTAKTENKIKIPAITSMVNNKASIMFRVKHEPGSLAKILTELAGANFNLTKIESRPIPKAAWEYQFWIDIENDTAKEMDKQILRDILNRFTQIYKIIGVYPAGKIYE